MLFTGMIMLALFPSLLNGAAFCINGGCSSGCRRRGRRNLAFITALEENAPACIDPEYDCSTADFDLVEQHKEDYVRDFDKETVNSLISTYCCALRTLDTEKLRDIAASFEEYCEDPKVMRAEHNAENGELSVTQELMLIYCPNRITSDAYKTESYIELFQVVLLGDPKFLSCPATKIGTDSIKLFIRYGGSKQRSIGHTMIEIEDKRYSWQSVDDVDAGEFDSVVGVKGIFHEEAEGEEIYDVVYTIEGVDLGKLMAEMQDIAYTGKYDIIENNCNHVMLKLLAAGLGCQAKLAPFMPILGLKSVLQDTLYLSAETVDNSGYVSKSLGSAMEFSVTSTNVMQVTYTGFAFIGVVFVLSQMFGACKRSSEPYQMVDSD